MEEAFTISKAIALRHINSHGFQTDNKKISKAVGIKILQFTISITLFYFHGVLCCVYLVAFSGETDVDQACSAHGLNNSVQC